MEAQAQVESKVGSVGPASHRRIAPWLLGGLVLFLLSILIALQTMGLWEIVPRDSGSDTLLLYALSSLNFAAFIVFALIFVRSLLKLRRERRERQLGSKIRTRLIKYFIALSLLPITAMAVFSYLFFNRTLEKWFSRLPDDVVYEARRVEDEAVAKQTESLNQMASVLALMIDEQPALSSANTLARLVQGGHFSAIELVSADGTVLAKSEASMAPAEREELEGLLDLARSSAGSAAGLADGKGFDAAVVPVSGERRLIVVPERRSDSNLSEVINNLRIQHDELVAKQRKVRWLGLSTLGLFTLMQLFGVTWIAMHIGRGIATPIKALAEASEEVARGNLAHRVTTVADDELALLAESFNQMTAQLTENRRRIEAGAAELRDKNLALEERRIYIETVLESLSTGVISLDENDRITTINAAAASMLRMGDRRHVDLTLAEVTGVEDRAILDPVLRRARRRGRAIEQAELARGSAQDGETVPVALTAIALRAQPDRKSGVVLVIEDLSELLAAQRAAAWSEVAQRMAHEIKNPLTPIQLSAERIAKRFQQATGGNGHHPPEPAAGDDSKGISHVVRECTATIQREVAGLKAMVDEFSRFARLPDPQLEPGDLNEVVSHSVALYEDRLDDVRLDVRLAPALPALLVDALQMRRVFVNLIDNALEALEDGDGERRITIATGYDPSRGMLLAEITDTGHGIPRADLGRLFQPYFSTRRRGTGLGLAIVQRIVVDHGGRIRAESNHPHGAKFILELPATAA